MTSEGVQVDPKDLEAVLKLKEKKPKNISEVRTLLGFLGYYRSFIQDISRIVRPLFKLQEYSDGSHQGPGFVKSTQRGNLGDHLPSKTPICWSSEHSAVVSANFDLPFVLHTDASSEGLGAVLYQEQSGKLWVIAYGSRTLTPAEKNYHLHSSKLEFLALKWAVCDKFRDYEIIQIIIPLLTSWVPPSLVP